MPIIVEIAAPKKAYGLKPGDIVRAKGYHHPLCPILRYVGISEGIPREPETQPNREGKVLVFESGLPITLGKYNYFYLLVEPKKHKTREDDNILECKVDELNKIGNIPDDLWRCLGMLEADLLRKIFITGKKRNEEPRKINLSWILQAYCKDAASGYRKKQKSASSA